MYLYLQPVAWASKSPLETFQLPGLQVVWLCRVVMCPWQWIQSNMFSGIIYEFKKYILLLLVFVGTLHGTILLQSPSL